MSKLYATINTDAGKTGVRTARGFKEISTAVQSWEGSVIVSLRINSDGKHMLTISKAEGSASSGGRLLFDGPLADLKNLVEVQS